MVPTPELGNVLRACYECWLHLPVPPEQRELCYRWVSVDYERLFGGTFPQQRLAQLANACLLGRGNVVRGGNRRYYTMPNPWAVYEILTGKAVLATQTAQV